MTTLGFKKAIATAMGVTALIGAALPASAQVSYMKVTVPFNFVAGRAELPAGDYRIQVDARTGVLQIQPASANATYSALLSPGGDSRSGAQSEQGALRFEKVNGKYYLGEVWRPAQEKGNKLSLQKSVEKERASSGGAVSTVDVTVR